MEYIPAKTIVTRTKDTSWFGTDYNMNLYRGCCHGCIYCDSRSDCYGTQDFDRVRAKQDALRIVRDDLRRKVKPGVVATGSMSDPYNPFERELELTRHALELLNAFGFGVAVCTKSDLLLRDMDLFQEIREHSPVLLKLTITAAEDALSQKVEPHTCPSSRRFEALARLSEAGLFCGVVMMPVLPFLEDDPQNIRTIVQRASDCGARFLYPAFGMTMRGGQREWFYQELERRFPGEGLPERYAKRYGEHYWCVSPRAKELSGLFQEECHRLGLLYRMQDITAAYRMGYASQQLTFFPDP